LEVEAGRVIDDFLAYEERKSSIMEETGAMSSIEVRRATADDADAIARLLHDFNSEYDEPSPGADALSKYSRQLLEEGEMTVLLAGDGPEGISLIRLRPSVWTGKPEAYLQELYVVPELRGQGIGRALLEATIAVAREAGATGVDLNTGETDTAARALYESMGFTNREGSPDGPSMLFYEREI
jgi:ribosomal protein S18 acetylase RimI-like enzyme